MCTINPRPQAHLPLKQAEQQALQRIALHAHALLWRRSAPIPARRRILPQSPGHSSSRVLFCSQPHESSMYAKAGVNVATCVAGSCHCSSQQMRKLIMHEGTSVLELALHAFANLVQALQIAWALQARGCIGLQPAPGLALRLPIWICMGARLRATVPLRGSSITRMRRVLVAAAWCRARLSRRYSGSMATSPSPACDTLHLTYVCPA